MSEGIEIKKLFSKEELSEILDSIEIWFDEIKNSFPDVGGWNYANKDDPKLFETNLESQLPDSLKVLLKAMLDDALKNPDNREKDVVRYLLERTGSLNSHEEDSGFHIDSKQIIWDENGNRVGYDEERGPDKYMAFVGRPGSLILEGVLDPSLTHSEATKLAKNKDVISKKKKIQLSSDNIYKVKVGSLLHGPPVHEDGLLITLSLIDEIPEQVMKIKEKLGMV